MHLVFKFNLIPRPLSRVWVGIDLACHVTRLVAYHGMMPVTVFLPPPPLAFCAG